MAKKKTTAEILAEARAQDVGDQPAPAAANAAPESEAAPAAEAPVESESVEEPAKSAVAKPKAAKPKSTSDILARLRAEKKGGGKAAKPAGESAAPAAKKAAPDKKAAPAKSPAAVGATGEKPSPMEMLKALREAKRDQSTDVAESATEPNKPARGKPAAKRKSAAKPEVARRNFLVACLAAPLVLVSTPFAAAWTFLSAATAVFSLGVLRFMLPNVLIEPPSRFKVGSPSDYPGGAVSTKWKAEFGVWIIHTEYEGKNLIYALFSICTHLGCTPNWLEGEQKFKCPCHGSGFYINGVNFEGPAPRPLERTAIRIAPDGMLEVDKSQKFQQELGQWDDAKSFIELA
jgi:cytochrome b6-f complex iron-sulfur subunit